MVVRAGSSVRAASRRALVQGLCLGALECGCASGARERTAARSLAEVSLLGGRAVLAGYCAAQMQSLGRQGALDDGGRSVRCVDAGPGVSSSPGDEREALFAVRRRWWPVLAAHDAVREAHDAVEARLTVGDDPVPAMVRLAWSYGLLVQEACAVGVTMPRIDRGRMP